MAQELFRFQNLLETEYIGNLLCFGLMGDNSWLRIFFLFQSPKKNNNNQLVLGIAFNLIVNLVISKSPFFLKAKHSLSFHPTIDSEI